MYDKIALALSRELQTRPFTMLTIVGLAAFSMFAWMNFARADDLSDIRRMAEENRQSIGSIVSTFKRSTLEQNITGTERELFFLERVVAERGESGESVDPIYHSRIHELRIEIDAQKRELQRAEAARFKP